MTGDARVPSRDRITMHLDRLGVQIGARPGGSPGNHAAAEYIRRVFASSGMAVEMHAFECPAWEALETRLEVDGIRLDAVANTFSRRCDVSAPAVALGTIDQLMAAHLNGRIAVLYGELTADPLSPKAWFLKSERDDRIIRLLEEKAPAAVITVQPRLGALERLIEDDDLVIPSATVPARTGLILLGAENPSVHLRIDARREAGRTWNVIGRQAGTSDNRIVLCAHYDTKVDTPGALDNAGGVAVMLALAEHLGWAGNALGLECVAFGNEESLPEGTDVYLRQHEGQLGEVVAVLNFDGVGHALDINTVTMMAHSTPFRELVDGVKQGYPGLAWTDPWLESNHTAFAWRGVPCLAFTSPAARYLAHLRADTVEWVSPEKLDELARFVVDVVEELQERRPDWTRGPLQMR